MHRIQQAFFEQLGHLEPLLLALERLPGAMFMIKSLESRYVFMSRALRETIHLGPDQADDVIGKTDFDLFPKITAETFVQNDQLVFKHGQPLINELQVASFFDHPARCCFSSKFPLHDRKGRVIGLVAINESWDAGSPENADLNRLLPTIDYIAKHYAEKIAVAELAQLCGMSESHFMRQFKQQMKMTAYAFVEQVRMFHAMDALKQSSAGILEIALACGFYDHSAFVKRFKKFTGTTPLRFRRAHQARFQPERAIAVPKPSNESP